MASRASRLTMGQDLAESEKHCAGQRSNEIGVTERKHHEINTCMNVSRQGDCLRVNNKAIVLYL